jgi:hypothetical protein
VVNYILQAKLIGGLGGDEDPLPSNGGNPHPLPNITFGGMWDDVVDGNNNNNEYVAHQHEHVAPGGNVAPVSDIEPIIHRPPQDYVRNNKENHDIQLVVEAIDALSAYHNMITNVLATFPDALDKISTLK